MTKGMEKFQSHSKALLHYVLSYASALVVLKVLPLVLKGFHGGQKFTLEGALISAAWFPMGLIVIMPFLHENTLYVGSAIYLCIACVGTITLYRYIFYAFVILLLINIGGCVWLVNGLSKW